MRTLLVAALLLASCGDMTVDPPSSRGPGGGAPLFCPNTADQVAVDQQLPIPYPNDSGGSFPSPSFFDPCYSTSGALTHRAGMTCYTCSDWTHYYAVLLAGQPCTQDTARSPGPPVDAYVVCVPPRSDGALTACDAARWGCQ